MTNQIRTVEIKAMGKARPRVTKRGTYMPESYEKWRVDFKRMFGPVDVSGLVKLSITSIRKLPKRTTNNPGDHCSPGPDVDNIAGSVMDALFSDDDGCVISVYCEKIWGDRDSMIVRLCEV